MAQPKDYLLAEDSPALALGFRQINVSKIGLRNNFPTDMLAEIFPSKRGVCISTKAKVSASSCDFGDIQRVLNSTESMATVFETKEERTPFIEIDLDREYPIDGLEIIADCKDRQNALRGLAVWTSVDRDNWIEIWRADPFHIAMGRDWLVNPYSVLPARYVKIGLRPAASLQMKPTDERMKIKKYALRLNSVKVYGSRE